ncbi:hypothetical protein ACFQ2J_07820 [Thalassobacillus hwangdonensis]|uniref:DUF3953 domain-containing protein n=1 Tax=Thalassobacillus hwangdonensis TaxID=546108 RepID=A0ABW3KZX7_9BACI
MENVRRKDTYWNIKYLLLLITLPIAFSLVNNKEAITAAEHISLIAIIVLLLFAGVMGLTEEYQPLKVYGALYLSSGIVIAYLGLVFIW